jgi:serine protease Do/serine protease DegQ
MNGRLRGLASLCAAMVALAGAGISVFRADAGEVPTLAPLLERITPGVVNIEIEGHVAQEQQPSMSSMSSGASPPPPKGQIAQHSSASGVVFDAREGLIVTTHKVIEHADRITVTLADLRKLPATPIGADPESDIALIKVEATNLTTIPLSDSNKLRVGDFLISMRYPFDVGQTATLGILSALHRGGVGLSQYEDFIQTDASSNPGDTGGAIVNLRGELVGLNSGVYGGGPNIGIGFAIPVNMVRRVADQILKYGEVRRPNLGIAVQDLTRDLIGARNLNARQTGALVVGVESGSAAERAGLKPGDVVTAIGTGPVRNTSDLRNRIWQLDVGEGVEVNVLRDGDMITIHATLAGRGHQSDK